MFTSVRLNDVTLIWAPIEPCSSVARSEEVQLAGNVHHGEAAIAGAFFPDPSDWGRRVTPPVGLLLRGHIAESPEWQRYLSS